MARGYFSLLQSTRARGQLRCTVTDATRTQSASKCPKCERGAAATERPPSPTYRMSLNRTPTVTSKQTAPTAPPTTPSNSTDRLVTTNPPHRGTGPDTEVEQPGKDGHGHGRLVRLDRADDLRLEGHVERRGAAAPHHENRARGGEARRACAQREQRQDHAGDGARNKRLATTVVHAGEQDTSHQAGTTKDRERRGDGGGLHPRPRAPGTARCSYSPYSRPWRTRPSPHTWPQGDDCA